MSRAAGVARDGLGNANLVGDLRATAWSDFRELIAFDLDGTLVDSRRDLADSANQLIVELGGPPLPEDAIGRMVGEGAAVLVRRALDAAGGDRRPAALAGSSRSTTSACSIHRGSIRACATWSDAARRHARVGGADEQAASPSERILEGLGIRHLFDDVVGGDGRIRESRSRRAAGADGRRRRRGQRTLLVGDSIVDHETARNAGVRAAW